MGSEAQKIVYEDPSALAAAVAERVVELGESPGDRPVSIALSGGSTPKRLYETLAVPPFASRVRWERLDLFFGDERAVPPDHADSNYGMVRRSLLLRVPARAYRMRAESGEAEEYEELVRKRVAAGANGLPSFDLILLGLGPDGHTASLFPGTAALAERERLVTMNEVPQLSTRRMTFTYPLINAAKRVWILVAGADKAEMVARCLSTSPRWGEVARSAGEGGADGEQRSPPPHSSLRLGLSPKGETAELPVLGVAPENGELVWWLDRAAAGA